MPNWDRQYYDSLTERYEKIVDGLDDRLEQVIDGRVTPAITDIPIGSARKMRAATIFFDIRHFSSRTGSPQLTNMKKALLMLDVVIPMVMHVVYDFGGYIEKNTGDGIMAIVGAEQSDTLAASAALSIATTTFCVLKQAVNPYLEHIGIEKVDARIGIDLGTLLIVRIGVPTGAAKQTRNFLAAVGPSANLSCRLQEMAGTNQIWTGDLIKRNAEDYRQQFFKYKTPQNWTWTYFENPDKEYSIWHYDAVRNIPD
jgi:class 3 adenylate cyclase